MVDSFIIFASQQNIDLPLSHSSLGSTLPSELPWTLFSPSKIRMVPFPTREYTDDEFQSIVKSVMGLLYVSPALFLFSFFFCPYIYLWYFSLCMVWWSYNCWAGTFWDFCIQSPGLSATLSLRRLLWVIYFAYFRTELICILRFTRNFFLSLFASLTRFFFPELAGAENKRRTLHDGVEGWDISFVVVYHICITGKFFGLKFD